MQYFKNSTSYNRKFPKTAERVRYYKENSEGVRTVCGVVQDLLDELVAEERVLAERSIAEEREKREQKAAEDRNIIRALALELFAQGNSAEKIAALMHEDVESVQAWLATAN